MRGPYLVALFLTSFSLAIFCWSGSPSAFAQVGRGSVGGGYATPSYPTGGHANPGYTLNPSTGNVYSVTTPYGSTPYYFPNGSPYGYRSPQSYINPYGGINPYGYYQPVPGFVPYGGSYYGVTIGGNNLHFWRAPSGYYYPWVGGYAYNSYPIYVVPPGQNNPMATLPPISTVVSDLDNYLDKAKETGKIDQGDFTSLKRRANDLLSKEKSIAYESGGLDQDQEADLRRDLDGLSSEVARRVRP
jgi:hypothetical protein